MKRNWVKKISGVLKLSRKKKVRKRKMVKRRQECLGVGNNCKDDFEKGLEEEIKDCIG